MDQILIKHSSGSRFSLFRDPQNGLYFYIYGGGLCFPIQLHLYTLSRNYFQCRKIAISIYDSFVSSVSTLKNIKG